MREECLWIQTSPEEKSDYVTLEDEISSDVCVIGGGITGLSTALHLAEGNTPTVVIDSDNIPTGGSSANVGYVNAGLWLPPLDIVELMGEKDGERINHHLGNAPSEVFKLIDRYSIQCNDTRTGSLHMAHNASGAKDLERRYEQFRQRGAPVELLQGKESTEATGSQNIHSVLLDRRAGTINPAAYTRGLARAADSAGAKLYTHTPAEQIERKGDKWRVKTPKGSILCERIVLATNAYTEEDWNAVKHHFFPGNFYQVASTPLGESAQHILPNRQGAWDTRTVLSSIRRDADGRLILGSLGRGETKPRSFIQAWANRMQRLYYPELGKVEWECTWTGRMAFTPDHMLRLFSPAVGILAVTGYNGRGVTTGTVVGKGFAKLIHENSDEELPLPIRDFKPVSAISARSFAYESGFSLYHAGQCLRVMK